jgi:hypothetical protein
MCNSPLLQTLTPICRFVAVNVVLHSLDLNAMLKSTFVAVYCKSGYLRVGEIYANYNVTQ